MADDTNNAATPIVITSEGVQLPPQTSATDTSNWDDRAFKAPDGKVHMETKQPIKGELLIAE